MPAKTGRDFLLKIESETTPDGFSTIGGLLSKSFTLNNEAIDATNHGSNEWRELLDGAGIKSMSISGSGIFTDHQTLSQVRADCINGVLRRFQIIDGDNGDTFTGQFKVTSLERAGEYNGEQTWSVSLESSGEIQVS